MQRGFVLLVASQLVACQDDITTPFPAGLEPIEDNAFDPLPEGPFDETLRISTTEPDHIRVHARGFVLVPFETLWDTAKRPEPNVSTCKTDEQLVTADNEPQYEASFLVHYIVREFLTVEWDDQWRFGRVQDFGMVKHQKIQGSDFIMLSVGTIQVLPTADPGVSELAFVEHLEAVGATAEDVTQGVQHNYDALVAAAHGNPIPPCPATR